jgi:hypothetical protein
LNVNGKTIQSGILNARSRQQSIKVADLPAGVYVISLEMDGKSETLKFLKN